MCGSDHSRCCLLQVQQALFQQALLVNAVVMAAAVVLVARAEVLLPSATLVTKSDNIGMSAKVDK